MSAPLTAAGVAGAVSPRLLPLRQPGTVMARQVGLGGPRLHPRLIRIRTPATIAKGNAPGSASLRMRKCAVRSGRWAAPVVAREGDAGKRGAPGPAGIGSGPMAGTKREVGAPAGSGVTVKDPPATQAVKQAADKGAKEFSLARLIPLAFLALSYVHHSTTGFVLPALLPQIGPDLGLTDFEGASLTLGYTVLYAIALVPVGAIADRVDRSAFLAGGLALWSSMTMLAASADGFASLLLARVGFAAAQAAQNPVCFSLIPELFPKNRSTAMSLYNVSIYLGRALSFVAAVVSVKLLGANAPLREIPLEDLDLTHMSILYLSEGGAAVVSPVYNYDVLSNIATVSGLSGPGGGASETWRSLLLWLGVPGLVLALLVVLVVEDPRFPHESTSGASPLTSSRFFAIDESLPPPPPPRRRLWDKFAGSRFSRSLQYVGERRRRRRERTAQEEAKAAAAAGALLPPLPSVSDPGPGLLGGGAGQDNFWEAVAGKGLRRSVRQVWSCKPFQAITAAATLNDVGGWALIAWQGLFYERVYHLSPDQYAPLLAVVLPVGGIIGGVGGGYLGDYLSRNTRYGRKVMLVGTAFLSAPLIAGSFLAPDYRLSFALLLMGFAMSEAWRAPSAIIMRDVTPNGLGSTGTALHLCVRNLIGGIGPLGVTLLEPQVGLQQAMLIVPSFYLLSAGAFWWTESVVEMSQNRAVEIEVREVAAALEEAAVAAAAVEEEEEVVVVGRKEEEEEEQEEQEEEREEEGPSSSPTLAAAAAAATGDDDDGEEVVVVPVPSAAMAVAVQAVSDSLVAEAIAADASAKARAEEAEDQPGPGFARVDDDERWVDACTDETCGPVLAGGGGDGGGDEEAAPEAPGGAGASEEDEEPRLKRVDGDERWVDPCTEETCGKDDEECATPDWGEGKK